MKVKFINVGRNNKCWQAECEAKSEGDIYDWLYGQVKKQGALLSSNLTFFKDGTIMAGFRTVGKFEFEK